VFARNPPKAIDGRLQTNLATLNLFAYHFIFKI